MQNYQQFEVGSCKVAALASPQCRVAAKAKCSKLAKTTEESQIDSRIVHFKNSRGCNQAFSSSANIPVKFSGNSS